MTPESTSPVPATTPQTPSVSPAKPVQNALTWIMTIKSPEDYQKLQGLVQQLSSAPAGQNPIAAAADTLGIIHFLRFVFLENNTKLGVMTIYDGDFDTYVNEFVNQVGPIFDAVLAHMADAPPLPTQTYRAQFNAYVRANDVPVVMFYSAYPTSTVLDIWAATGK
ncbi:hypothetical protein IAD21_00020 [Abditibacteriota bacterium]|nr:hypothetical protein IAD21_00020 [Abditibacteriota bacterium]